MSSEEGRAKERAASERLAGLLDARTLKNMAVRFRMTVGQVRGLIARHGIDEVVLEREAAKLRRR